MNETYEILSTTVLKQTCDKTVKGELRLSDYGQLLFDQAVLTFVYREIALWVFDRMDQEQITPQQQNQLLTQYLRQSLSKKELSQHIKHRYLEHLNTICHRLLSQNQGEWFWIVYPGTRLICQERKDGQTGEIYSLTIEEAIEVKTYCDFTEQKIRQRLLKELKAVNLKELVKTVHQLSLLSLYAQGSQLRQITRDFPILTSSHLELENRLLEILMSNVSSIPQTNGSFTPLYERLLDIHFNHSFFSTHVLDEAFSFREFYHYFISSLKQGRDESLIKELMTRLTWYYSHKWQSLSSMDEQLTIERLMDCLQEEEIQKKLATEGFRGFNSIVSDLRE